MNSDRWEIVPYVGLGALRFGLTRSQIRSQFDITPATFRRGPFATNDTDAYDELGLHLDYDPRDLLRSLMVFDRSPIHFRNIALLNRPLQEIIDLMAALGIPSRYDDEGYWIHDAGFVLYAPDGAVKAVTAFRRGYYEEEVALATRAVESMEGTS